MSSHGFNEVSENIFFSKKRDILINSRIMIYEVCLFGWKLSIDAIHLSRPWNFKCKPDNIYTQFFPLSLSITSRNWLVLQLFIIIKSIFLAAEDIYLSTFIRC